MIAHIFKHARERLAFEGEVSAAKRLTACKTFLRLETKMMLMRHRSGESGLRVAAARATMIDLLIENLFDYAMRTGRSENGEAPVQVSVIGLGGYGRAELSPRSDVDIMFLYPAGPAGKQIDEFQELVTREVLYLLWDTGLKIGHSTRTVDEVFELAKSDMLTKTSLLESRLIAGSETLFENFFQAYRNFYLRDNPKGYIEARLDDQAVRRAKFGGTVFLQEPDIKSGVGGMRDYQNTLWMARVKLGITAMDELSTLKYIRRSELREFIRAYDFLLRVRNELHFLSRHHTDLLDMASQPKVAQNLGYTKRHIVERVEAFMRDYYRHARTIHRISRLVENRLSLAIREPEKGRVSFREVLRARRHEKIKRIDGFLLRGRELAAEKSDVFKEDPRRLIRVFRHCQQLDCRPDLALSSLIRDSLPLLNRSVLRSPEAALSFRSILEDAGKVFPILDLMHDHEVLGKYIPEFGNLTCLVQHEYYHRYTADIHTLTAISHLDQVFSGGDPLATKYRDELHETERPTLLYLILLLHDIGKSDGIKDHCEQGAERAVPILARLGISERDTEIVTFVIKNHLSMARFWQKHDIDDPNTSAAFAELVEDPERLRHLYVHTYCDSRGTATTLWNSYKDILHRKLFVGTLERLTEGRALDKRIRRRKEMTYEKLIAKKFSGISQEEITAHFHLLPERYFIHTDEDEIALHVRMVNQLLQSIARADSVGALRPIIDWKDDINRSLTVVNVVTWDRAGLFSKLAGAFSVAGLNILSAKVISRTDHIAIDTFHVVEPERGVVQSHKAMDTFASTVENALVQNKDLLPEIEAQAEKIRSSRFIPSSDKGFSPFSPSVDVYHELALHRTIVEVEAPDRIGLLYRLSRIIFQHGFDITFARINTERGMAIDTFHVESAEPESNNDAERLQALKVDLRNVIEPSSPEAATG